MGKNLIPVYDEVLKLGFADGGAIDENLDKDLKEEKSNIGQRILGYVAGSVTPMISALIGGGMLKVFLLLFSRLSPSFAASSTYTMLGIVANAPFYFMPIWVAYGASKKLGGNPVVTMVIMAACFGPDFQTMISTGDPVTMFGINVPLRSYASSLMPALLIAYAEYWVEKWLNKVIPGILKSIFVGALTFAIVYFLAMVILCPLGAYVGSLVTTFFLWLYGVAGPIAVAAITAALPYMIMTGMHTVFGPFMVQLLSDNGFDPIFRPALLLHNMSEGGAMLGIMLKAKNKELKTEAGSLAVTCIFAGVTEPTIYGFTLPLKKPLWAVSIGGAVGGFLAGLLGAHNYEMGYSTLLALPIFEDTMGAMAIAVVAAIAVSCIMTMIFGFDEEQAMKSVQ
ncbi:MAG: PTS transporter subunit EIIC, partial [Bulleidia sp.]